MTIQAQLPDGRILEFPDGTADEIVDSKVKEMLSGGAPSPDPNSVTTETTTPVSEKPLMDRVLEATPQVGGGIVGGLTAAAAGVTGAGGVMALAPVAGAVALGAAGGEALKQIGQQLSGSLDAPKTSLEAFKRIAMAGVEEGTWEAVGGLAAKGFGKILAPFKPAMVEGAEKAMSFFRDKIKPVVFLPSEATESRAIDILGNVAEASIIGGSTISKYKTARIKFFDDFADSLIDEFGQRVDPTELGNLFVAAIERKKAAHAEASKVLYNNVSEAIKRAESRPSISNLIKDIPDDEIIQLGSDASVDLEDMKFLMGNGKGVKESLPKGIYHGSSSDFASFKGNNIFLTEDPEAAVGFSSMSQWFHEGADAEGKRRLYKVSLKKGKTLIANKKKYPSLFDDSGGPSDHGAQKFLKENPEYNFIKWKDIDDGGSIMNVIFTNKGSNVKIDKKWKVTERWTEDLLPSNESSEVLIPTESLKSFAKHPRALSAELGGIEAKNAGDDLLAAVMDLPDELTFDAAKELRSRLISRVDEFSVINKKAPAIGKAKKMINLIDSAIESSLRVFERRGAGGKLYHGSSSVFTKSSDMPTGHRGYFATSDPKVASKFGKNIHEVSINSDKIFDPNNPAHQPDIDAIYAKVSHIFKRGKESFAARLKEGNHAVFEDQQVKYALEDLGYRGNVQTEDGAKVIRMFNKEDFTISPLGETSPGPLEAWRTANRFYKEGQEKFNSVMIRRLIKLADDTGTGAEMIAPAIFKPGQVSRVRKIKNALLDMKGPVPIRKVNPAAYRIGEEESGRIYAGKIHADAYEKIPQSDLDKGVWEGFVDQNGKFVSSLDAKRIYGVNETKAISSSGGEWQKLQGFFMQHLMSKSTNVDGQIIGKRLLNNISGKPNSFGLEMLNEVLSPAQVEALQTFGRAMEIAQARQSEGAGRVLIQLTQAGAMGAALTGNLQLPAATVIFGPALLSKMMLRPSVLRMLTRGIELPAHAPEALGLISRLAAAAHRIESKGESDDQLRK